MILKHFYFQILIRVSLILANCIAVAFVVGSFYDTLILLNLIIILGIQVWLLVKLVNQVNYSLAGFFESLEMEDLMLVHKGKSNMESFKKLNDSLQKISSQIKKARLSEVERYQYFKVVTEHVNVGLIAFDQNGNVELFNKSAASITGIKSLRSIKQLEAKNSEFAGLIKTIKPSEQKVIKIRVNSGIIPVTIRFSEIRFRERHLRLISLQNIHDEMEEKELESWQQLIRILTHEIMNSVGPIISSIDTITGFLSDEENSTPRKAIDLTDEIISDAKRGMQIIKERSLGLREFVDKFRSLTSLPALAPETVRVETMIQEVIFLMERQLTENNINIITGFYPGNMSVQADKKGIIQVLINIINNSIDALDEQDKKEIKITSFFGNEGQAVIQIADNGKGIDPEFQEKIFIPFFTTRENGSGIGLSLSKQIMKRHGGKITMQSVPGYGSTFSLIF